MIMNDIISTIRKSNKIGVTFHLSPDGDALGSSLALMQSLKKLGKDCYIISKEKIPEVYNFLPYADEINMSIGEVLDETDCVIVLDCGNLERIAGDLKLKSKHYVLINMDHHLSNDLYGDLNFVDTNAAAVGEIIYQIIRLMGIVMDKDMATCMYTSLVTDTGGFKYSNTTSVTHTIAGDLINIGIDFSDIHRIIFENKKYERVKLYAKAIDTINLMFDNKLCVMEVTKKMLNEVGVEPSDTSDIVSIGMGIDVVEVCALLKESDGGIKVSLRSKKDLDVRKIAESFGGGGHTKAAGLFLKTSLDEAKNIIIKAVEKELIG